MGIDINNPTAIAKELVRNRKESGIIQTFRDSLLFAQRNLVLLTRFPTAIVAVVMLPILFLSGFLLTFQRLMAVQEINYVQYLVPIITLQSIFFTAMGSAVHLSMDMNAGMLRRCRAMPISRLAIFGGLAIAYLVRALITLVILLCLAHFYGFRFQGGLFATLGFIGLSLLFAIAAIAGYSTLALALKKPELVDSLTIVPYAPLLLLSTGFSPKENFPNWLQPIVSNQPVSHTADALRALANGSEVLNPLLWSLAWLLGLLIIFTSLATFLYQNN